MNRDTLRNIFNAPYQSTIWKSFLKELFRNLDSNYFQTPVDLKDDTLVKHKDVEHIWEFGDITLADGKIIKFYEVVLKENQQVTKNRVGLRNIVSGEIGFGYIDGAIITYHNHKAKDWRFTFISKSLYWDEDNNEVKTETHPKRYTYLLGQNETVKTAVNQFEWLFKQIQTRELKLEDILKAFSVEKLSKEFYDGYFHQFETIVDYIVDNEKAFKHFLKQVKNSSSAQDAHDKAEHLVSDFVKKFLGRIVFLYFLQKKGWMGVPLDKDWGDGQRDFIQRLFEEFADKNHFYEKALVPLFFHTLNEDRKANNDVFSVTSTRIPYLNGGLFEKDDTEPLDIQFEPQRFIELFSFFSNYNFTVDESSPDDQDIGVDPEMLGHIFENLLEDNKDKGAFYTPKEIVHYMTQESLIEYLSTHLPESNKDKLNTFVKRKQKADLSDKELRTIDALLEDVKICDPAIGSGAFPMGLLHEIFALKGLIAFERGYTAWSPARVKESIIENSIYGVDIEEGAVDIARLRFWLSLVVDEPTPRPLPNLDYKIICGNSLISRYALDAPINEVFREFNKGRENGDKVDLDKYKSLVKEYLHEADHDKKVRFKQLIEDVKSAFKTFYSSKELKKLREKQGELLLLTGDNLFGNNKNAAEKRRIASLRKEITKLEKEKLEREKARLYHNAVEWRFEFPNLLDTDGNFEGFDIVIGNPPYIKEATNRDAFKGLKSHEIYQGKMDLWYMFGHLGVSISKENGISCFIATNNWVTNDGASKFRNFILKNSEIREFVDFGDFKVFITAGIQTMVYLLKKNHTEHEYAVKYSRLNEVHITKSELKQYIDSTSETDKWTKKVLNILPEKYFDKYITFGDSPLISKIISKSDFNLQSNEIHSGIDVLQDFVSKRNVEKINSPGISVGDGVFVLTKEELSGLNLTKEEEKKIKPYFTTKELNRHKSIEKNQYWIIYSDREVFENIHSYPNIKAHLDRFKPIMTSVNKPYGLHRSRNEKIFIGEKIFGVRKCAAPSFSYTNYDSYVSRAFLIIKTKRINCKYLNAVLNSKLIKYWLLHKGKLQGNNFQVDKTPLMELPLIQADSFLSLSYLNDYILLLNRFENQINDFVPNSHIAELFEEIIDALVFELYFPEDLQKYGLKFNEFAERDFVSVENKTESEQETIIHDIYQKLRDKNNEIRNNLKAMKIELRDLIMPILTA